MRYTLLFVLSALTACAQVAPTNPQDAPARADHTIGITNTLDGEMDEVVDWDGDGVALADDCDDEDSRVGALLYESYLDGDTPSDFAAPPQLGDNWSWASGVAMANDGGQQGLLGQTGSWDNVVVYAQVSAAGTEIGCGFDCHSECAPFEPEDGCLTQSQAIALGVVSVSTSGTGAFTVSNSHPTWDICLDGYVMYDNVGTQAIFVGEEEEGMDFRIPANSSSTFYYGSWTTNNGSFQPYLGSWSIWCFQQGTVLGSHQGYLTLGAMIPAGIAALVQNDTDLDGDGVEDHVDYVSYSGVQTQYNVWDYQNTHAALAVGKLASDAGDGTVTIDYSVTNRGALRGDGTLTDTLPAWWVVESCDVAPSQTVNADHTTTLSWAVSVEGCDADCSSVYEETIRCSISYGPHTDLVYAELPAASIAYHDGEQDQINHSLEVSLFDYDWNADGALSCGETDRWRAGILVRAEEDADQDEGFHGYRCAIAHNAEGNCYEDGHFLQLGEFMDIEEDDIASECNGSCENPSFDQLGRSNHDGALDIAAGDVATLSFWAVDDQLYCVAEDQEGNSTVVTATDDTFTSGATGMSTLNMYGTYDWIRVCEAYGLPVD